MTKRLWIIGSAIACLAAPAYAMDLDWSGQFRTEAHWVRDYALTTGDQGLDQTVAPGGYNIRGGGAHDAQFQTLFLRLRPKLVVNDNVYIKSEWWLGDPIYGFYGAGAPYDLSQKQWYSSQSRGSAITAQRYWAEIVSDVGTFQLGRAPLNWGVGIVWNNGDGLWDRYQSTGDVIRLVSKFGSFSFVPSIVKYTMGNSVGGACDAGAGGCGPVVGGAGVSDYSLALKYENPDEDFEGGVNFIKRIGGASQDPVSGYRGFNAASDPSTTQAVAGFNYNTWDLYGRKAFGKLSLAGEVPIVSGDLGGVKYNTFAVALEANWKLTDAWDFTGKAGRAPGQPDMSTDLPDQFKAFYFHPGYKIALIMFNYQLNNFAGPNTQNNPNVSGTDLASPYDNPIVNAQYLALGVQRKLGEKWDVHGQWTYAKATDTAAAGQNFYNTREHRFRPNNSGMDQDNSLGWELDLGAGLQWDENLQFGADAGWWFPGAYYAFTNTGSPATTAPVFATVVKVGVNF